MTRKPLIALLALPIAATVACGSSTSNSTGPVETGGAEAGAAEVAPTVDMNAGPDTARSDVPDMAVCDQLAATARAQFQATQLSVSSLSCQIDSDCSLLGIRSLNCVAACGGPLVRTADIAVITTATANTCDPYFSAGCPEKYPPCPNFHAVCDRGTCALGTGPSGSPGTVDAGVDAGAVDAAADRAPADSADTSQAKDSAPDDTTSNIDGGMCTWPARFTPTGDTSAVGCWASAISGTVDGGQFNCSSSEFALHCAGSLDRLDSGCEARTMPAPDLALGCRILPIPTAFNQSYYCCPCGQGNGALSDAGIQMSCPQ